MGTDAIVLTHDEDVQLRAGTGMNPIVQLAPMQPGRSYVVWAMGSVDLEDAQVTLELEAFDARNTVALLMVNERQRSSFSLAVATTVPADDELFTVAKLSAEMQTISALPSFVVVQTARLVVLAVDSVSVQAL
jgi:hypothetical protein